MPLVEKKRILFFLVSFSIKYLRISTINNKRFNEKEKKKAQPKQLKDANCVSLPNRAMLKCLLVNICHSEAVCNGDACMCVCVSLSEKPYDLCAWYDSIFSEMRYLFCCEWIFHND